MRTHELHSSAPVLLGESIHQTKRILVHAGDMNKINKYNVAIVSFVALGSFSYGFNSSIIGSVLGLPSFYSYFNLTTSGPRADWSTQMIGGMWI